jgi:hypothetical protein
MSSSDKVREKVSGKVRLNRDLSGFKMSNLNAAGPSDSRGPVARRRYQPVQIRVVRGRRRCQFVYAKFLALGGHARFPLSQGYLASRMAEPQQGPEHNQPGPEDRQDFAEGTPPAHAAISTIRPESARQNSSLPHKCGVP